jgi:EAL domain-containing protein (putative c-di-GMP-specific phosphodiesterase class I)
VETLEQLRELQALSCNEVQRHFVSRAVPTSDVASLLLKRFLFPPSVQQGRMAAV